MKNKKFVMAHTTSLLSDIIEVSHEYLIEQVDKVIDELNVLGGRGMYNPDLYFRKLVPRNVFIYGQIGIGYELSERGVLLIMSIAAPLSFRIKSLNVLKSEMNLE